MCSQADLEAVARQELEHAAEQRVLAHVARCRACARELAWLHTESRLACRPDRDVATLWRAVERRAQAPRRSVALLGGLVTAAAAAAAAVALALVPPRPPARTAAPAPAREPVSAPAPAPDPAPIADPVPAAPPAAPNHGKLQRVIPAKRPVVLAIEGDDTQVEVGLCHANTVKVTTYDSRHARIDLAETSRGQVRATFDGGPLVGGRARVLLPRGSSLRVQGNVTVRDRSRGRIRVER